ncbi:MULTISPECIES: WhiB family transcriptional regulator [Mycobacteriaceae]|uniref:WhiB family transcriptional regulator n=1 Tax=Mycobacteriaceae TaxID=1762 RepID=UPI0025DD4A99|nr:WhiB family transcriptional regulator [Mycolicibacterium sp.]
MNTLVGQSKSEARWIANRIAAHRMNERGQSIDVIADHLRVTTRSVTRYLGLPCPPPPQPEVELKDFIYRGACGSFPELDWTTRSTTMQADCKAVCTYCPVLAQCRTYGLTKGLQDRGVWGALTANERARMVRQGAAAYPAEGVGVDDDERGAA